MSSFPIFTALNVPTVTSYPSVRCLQWSTDGQIRFVTKTAIHILTPDPGINFDISSVIKASIDKVNSNDKLLGWFRTMIQFDKLIPTAWPEYSQEWGATSLGSLDATLWAAVCSPSNLSSDAGCVIAALTSNMDLTLWAAGKNNLKGEWIMLCEVTPFLLGIYGQDESLSPTTWSLQAQITSITWSPQADFGLTPTPSTDGSLLVAGNRAGSLIFLRFDGITAVQLVHTLPVDEGWVTHLAFSPWVLSEIGQCGAYLAFGLADGSIGLIKVKQHLQLVPSISPFGLEYAAQVMFECQDEKLIEADKHGITALTWVEIRRRSPILVYCKPGIVCMWSSLTGATSSSFWSGSRTLLLRNQKLSVGSSPLHPISGIQYYRRRDALILSLFDGSFHVIHDLSRNPSWTPSAIDDPLSTEMLSRLSRSVFIRAEHGNAQYADVNRISGMVSYDGSATVLWVHEACRPSDFSYKHDARHNSTLIAAQMWDEYDDEATLQDLSDVLNENTTSGRAPLDLLRPIFFHLRKDGKLNQLHSRILEILQTPFDDHSINISFLPWAGGLAPGMRSEFRRSLKRHLFGWDALLSLRMRLSIADFSWKLSEDPKKQGECGHVAQFLLNTISHRVLRTIIRHLAAAVPVLTPSDVPFVLRIVVQSLLPGSPPDLSTEAQNLSAIVNAVMLTDPQSSTVSNSLDELCPACHAEVPLQDITSAVCINGHTWARCSVTSFILSTPLVRTCIGCSRKAFLPLSSNTSATPNWLPSAARGWVVEELLEAVHRCLFCGNRFVSVL